LSLIALGWLYLKAKIVQDCKEPKVEIYKPIWGLVFKCNGSGRQFNLIQFSQEYNNQRNKRKEKKDQTRTQDVTEFDLKYLRLWDFQPLTIEVETKY
jgi:hypothetical protein